MTTATEVRKETCNGNSNDTNQKPIKEFKKHQENLKCILKYSNASLIRGKGSDGYSCNFCANRFQLPQDLKSHFLQEHNDIKSLRLPKFSEYLMKLDITDLKCNICDHNFEKLITFTQHLYTNHNKKIYTDVHCEIIPFKFDTDALRCVVCLAEFTSFKTLQEHMHVHFSNYFCDTCSAGFVTKRRLIGHKRRHSVGCHKCKHCEKTFGCEQKRRDHEQRIHLGLKMRNKCKHCDQRFSDYWTKVEHMVKQHGVPRVTLICRACERTFDNQRALTRHVKKDHLLQRNHVCSVCGMRFYLKHRLKDHMLVHTGEKKFQCNECNRLYATKKSVRRHLKLHVGDKCHTCSVCAKSFPQRTILANHMKSNHNDKDK